MLTKQPSRPLCKNCNVQLAKTNGKSVHGFTKYHKYCSSCAKIAYDSKYSFLLNKKKKCESCGFVPVDNCQLDIIYKDNNKKNKTKNNMKTLCANCSRLHNKKIKQKSLFDITVDCDMTI